MNNYKKYRTLKEQEEIDEIKRLFKPIEEKIKKFVYKLINKMYKCTTESFYNDDDDEFILKIGLTNDNADKKITDVIFDKLDNNYDFIEMLMKIGIICRCIVYEVNNPNNMEWRYL